MTPMRSLSKQESWLLTEWLERQVRLEKARQAMRELSHGLGGGSGHDVARTHDTYLYGRPAA